MNDFDIGVVIPIYQEKYISGLVQGLQKLGSQRKFTICIVNDGQTDLVGFLARQNWPENILVHNLLENRMYAGANNAGWHYLIERYPALRYLGTLNDDTKPKTGWLDVLADALEKYSDTALAVPVMETTEGWLGTRKNYATWRLSESTGMAYHHHRIKSDTFVPVVSGFCFLARRDALVEVGFFDESFHNSCEDIDLSLKLTSRHWRLVTCKDACVFHYGGASRYLRGAKTNIRLSRDALANKWGQDLRKFNNLDSNGFLRYDTPRE